LRHTLTKTDLKICTKRKHNDIVNGNEAKTKNYKNGNNTEMKKKSITNTKL